MATPPFFDDPASTPGPAPNSPAFEHGAPTTARTVAAAQNTLNSLAERASRSERSLREAAAHSAARYQDTREQVRSQLSASVERARGFARQHPLLVAGTAFAAGALLTAACRRKH